MLKVFEEKFRLLLCSPCTSYVKERQIVFPSRVGARPEWIVFDVNQ